MLCLEIYIHNDCESGNVASKKPGKTWSDDLEFHTQRWLHGIFSWHEVRICIARDYIHVLINMDVSLAGNTGDTLSRNKYKTMVTANIWITDGQKVYIALNHGNKLVDNGFVS